MAAAAIAGCSDGAAGAVATPAYPSDPGAMTVSAGENFYGDLLHQLGGSKLRIYAFLSNPNADPHQYETNSGSARAIADSRLVIENGLGYDAFMDKLLQASPDSKRVVINVQALVGAPDGANPHLWYDPTVTPRVAKAAAGALAKLDPANAAGYAANLGRVLSSLQPIADKVANLKSRFQGAPVALTEPVYGYMADAVGLRVLSPQEFMKAIEEGNDPPSQAVAAEQDLITQHRVKVLLYNSQTVTKITSAIRDLAASNSVPVVGISETEPPGQTYQQWQLDELDRLEAALSR
jgi:zinc/manganese transport system substrate-binding protein